jgi:hypothetical protein
LEKISDLVLLLDQDVPFTSYTFQRCYSHKRPQYCTALAHQLGLFYPHIRSSSPGHHQTTWCNCWLLLVVSKDTQNLLPSNLRNHHRRAILADFSSRLADLFYGKESSSSVQIAHNGAINGHWQTFGTLLAYPDNSVPFLSCFR